MDEVDGNVDVKVEAQEPPVPEASTSSTAAAVASDQSHSRQKLNSNNRGQMNESGQADSSHSRRRRRLDRELGFSSPGPAFQLQPPSADEPCTTPGHVRRSTRHSSRTPKPSKAALESGLLRSWTSPSLNSKTEEHVSATQMSGQAPGTPSIASKFTSSATNTVSPTLASTDSLLERCKRLHEQLLQADMETLHQEHDALVRELFHLTKFVTMTSYDPTIAFQDTSEVFAQFRSQYDLATKIMEDQPRLTRRALAERRKSLGIDELSPCTSRSSASRLATSSPLSTHSPTHSQVPPAAKRIRLYSRSRDKRRALSPPNVPAHMDLISLSSGSALDPRHPPHLTYMSPWQVPAAPSVPGGSLAAFYQSFCYWDDEIVRPDIRAERLARESAIYMRLDSYKRHGLSLEAGTTTALAKFKPHDPPRSKAHWDFVLDGVVACAQRMRHLSKHRMQLAKKVSRMVSAYWERALHSDEREQKMEWRRQRALAKWTMREVQRQWRLAVTVIRGRKQAAERAEREKLGKKQLQAILEQSTQMLETQHADLSNLVDNHSEEEEQEEVDEDGNKDETETEGEEDEDVGAVTHVDASVQDMDEDHDQDAESQTQALLASSENGSDERDEDALIQASGEDESDGSSRELDDERLEHDMWEQDEEDDDEDDELQAEANLPLDELMKKYGYAPPSSQSLKDTRESESETESSNATAPEIDDAKSDESSASDSHASLHMLLDSKDDVPAHTSGKVRLPFLFRGTLRPYQQVGMEWLISLYNNQVNGILADEMGLGKTIQTIALLAHLACDRGNWGPHLIIAPTSVMLNWEMEFKKFLPGFKILAYFGSQKQRKAKRVGWNTPNSFHVCITSYQLVLADQHIFRRKPWSYLVLDEAHHIKNFRSQRWQTLLGFNSERRLLLTGTPLQNNLMDLWSLMYFLMPQGIAKVAAASGAFSNMKDFQDWFSNPLGKAAENANAMDDETRATVAKLHTVLRPFVLRRLKSDVEQEMPKKYEHVMPCRLSKRQRFLYNDFMSRAKTRESLASGNYMSIINCLMQLRKVCNHPDLFEPRPIVTPFASRAVACDYEIKDLLVRRRLLQRDPWRTCDPAFLHLQFVGDESMLTPLITRRYKSLDASEAMSHAVPQPPLGDNNATASTDMVVPPVLTVDAFRRALSHRRACAAHEHAQHAAYVNRMRCSAEPVYGRGLFDCVRLTSTQPVEPIDAGHSHRLCVTQCDALRSSVLSVQERSNAMHGTISRFAFATPPVLAPAVPRMLFGTDHEYDPEASALARLPDPLHTSAVALQVSFPDASLLQYDCGKLQQLDTLMRRLVTDGHRVLIFTQMTKVLDILEKFFNYHGYRYLRLDGATKVEQRQALTERFNRDSRISAFILSTRSGGLGINLVGADTVIFYDLDWNAAIESQCMDRAHRIGQTRDVHIYRFVSEHTIEENMLRKANQKRRLDQLVIQEGEFTTDRLIKNDWRDMLDEGGTSLGGVHVGEDAFSDVKDFEQAFRAAEDAEDAAAVHVANEEYHLDHADFEGDVCQSVTDVRRSSPPSSGAGWSSSHLTEQSLLLPHLEPTGESKTVVNNDVLDECSSSDVEDDEEDPVGSIDDYMLRYVTSHPTVKEKQNTNRYSSMVEADWQYFGS